MRIKKEEEKTSQEAITPKEKNKSNKKAIFRYVKLKTLIILVVMFEFNSYAWFIFATRVSSSLEVHVSSWNVSFKVDDQESSTNMIIDVGKIYPGMPDFQKVVTVISSGETKATLSYKYKKVILMGKTYEVGSQYTEEDLKNMMEQDNPFKVSVVIDQEHLGEKDGTGSFTINVTWPFESGNDELDTQWGEEAYEYYETNGDSSSLHIILELIAKQDKDNN